MSLMFKLKKALKSCNSCAYAKEIIIQEDSVKVYCRYIANFINFMKFRIFMRDCLYYRPMDCYSCKHQIKIIHKDREISINNVSPLSYKYFDVWYLDCEKQGLTEDLRIKCGARDICVPSCSLWWWREHDRT